jgi:hypothetical protein
MNIARPERIWVVADRSWKGKHIHDRTRQSLSMVFELMLYKIVWKEQHNNLEFDEYEGYERMLIHGDVFRAPSHVHKLCWRVG